MGCNSCFVRLVVLMIEKCAPIYCRGGAVGEPSYFIGKFVAMIKNDLLLSEFFYLDVW